jgi:hypothetical protein
MAKITGSTTSEWQGPSVKMDMQLLSQHLSSVIQIIHDYSEARVADKSINMEAASSQFE